MALVGVFPGAATLKGPALTTAFKAYWRVTTNGVTCAQIDQAARSYAVSLKKTRGKSPERLARWLAGEKYLSFIAAADQQHSNWDSIPAQVAVSRKSSKK